MNVTPPMHERITPEQLQRICALVRARLSTVEDAFAMEFGITRQQVWKCRRVGQKAAEKEERGEELTPGEQRALWMDRELRKAQAYRSHQLTRDALGIDKDGKRNCRNESINAFKMLVLTSDSYRLPADEGAIVESEPPAAPEITEADVRAYAAAHGLALVPVPLDDYTPEDAAPANDPG